MKNSSNFLCSLRTIAAAAAAGFMGFALAAPSAHAQVGFGVHIGAPPPPLRYEVRPAAPGPGYAWVDGYYDPNNGRYRWHPGYWNRAPYQGAYYVHPHWDHYPDGWHQHEGHWDHEDHDAHYWDNQRDRDDHHDDRNRDQNRDGNRPPR